MLLSLAQWLQSLSPEWGFLRVFQYITFRAVMAAMTAPLIEPMPPMMTTLKAINTKSRPIVGKTE